MNTKWKIEERILTKKLVDDLIGKNVNYNRPLKKRRVNMYAESMRSDDGFFFVVPTSMLFVVNENDELLDGQHRLYAIRESESYGHKAIFVIVPNNHSKLVYTLIDGGAKRTVADILRNKSITTFIKGYFRQANRGVNYFLATNPMECSKFYEDHKKICDEITANLPDTHGLRKLRTGHKAALFEQIVDFGISIEELSDFLDKVDNCELIRTNRGYKISNDPINNLAIQLEVHYGTGGGSAREKDDYIRMTEAINSFHTKSPCHKLNP